ncbi:MAG: hypothetical protein J6C77_02765 [Muribaculaceae bacterium]|nr:hypothetical protein [Muribaculaceae bacterium]
MRISVKAVCGCILCASALCACGGNNDENGSTTELNANSKQTDPVYYSENELTPAQIDSIAVYHLDFLSPGEGAGLLYYYYTKADQSRSALTAEQIKRKYKDIYDILRGNMGSSLTAAIEKVKRAHGVDLSLVYDEFAGLLDTADDGGTAISTESTDTADVDVVPDDATNVEVTESNGIITVNPTVPAKE